MLIWLKCFFFGHDYQIMFKYPDKPQTDKVTNPIGIVEGFKYLEEAEMVRMSQGKKIKYCMKCGKEK